jgi:diadenosine tetraphosphate (Ap4A) HIT family hydrolase
MQRLRLLALVVLVSCGSGQQAAPAPSAPQQAGAAAPQPDLGAQPTGDRRALMRQMRTERETKVRERGEIFARIAVKHDYTGEYVLFHDQDVTAFLDIKDPQHPRFKPEDHEEEEPAESGPLRAHILVVPNLPRETIGKTLASDITIDDLEQALKVMRAATQLATRLAIKNPRIYVKSPARAGVGYLHVHIVGQRDPSVPYPPALH